eukprot:tig00000829_g4649.t1
MATVNIDGVTINAKDFIKTYEPDPRFPNQNQTKHCWTSYNEFHLCRAARGEGTPLCEQFRRTYTSMCPEEWIQKWDEQRANGLFAGPANKVK